MGWGTGNLVGGSGGLNFKVVGYATEAELLADTPKENTIGVITQTAITNWVLSNENPYIEYRDLNLMDGLTFDNGYFSISGTISIQSSSNPELYTNEYIPVEYGKSYNWEYSVSESKSMWLAIAEYTGSYTFKQRLVPVSSVTGTKQTGTYTPSASDVTAVRLSWRTFPNTTYELKFIEPNVEFTVGEPEGALWISTGTGSPVEFNALKKNTVMVYPLTAKQRINGAWVDVTAMSYQGGEWTEWRTYLYNSGDECTEITGGWANKRPSGYFSSNGSVVKNAQTMQTTATKGQYIVAVTTNKINLADLNTLTFNVNSRQNGNTEFIFLCVFDDTLKDSNAIAKINGDSVQIGTNIIDITSLNDAYYIGFGCASDSGTASIKVSEVYMT